MAKAKDLQNKKNKKKAFPLILLPVYADSRPRISKESRKPERLLKGRHSSSFPERINMLKIHSHSTAKGLFKGTNRSNSVIIPE